MTLGPRARLEPPGSSPARPGRGRARRRRRRDADRRRPEARATTRSGRASSRSPTRGRRDAAGTRRQRRRRSRSASTTRCSPARAVAPTGRRPTSAPAWSARSAPCRSTPAGCGPATSPASPTRPSRPGGTWRGCSPPAASPSRATVPPYDAAGRRRGRSPQVLSPTVAELVEAELATSDNDLAEALLRLVAVARRTGRARSTSGTDRRRGRAVGELGLATDGRRAARRQRARRPNLAIAPETLGRLLRVAAAARSRELRPLLTGLPVAGFTGTLSLTGSRRRPERRGAGLVRAKTGTLTGVSTLAGRDRRSAGAPSCSSSCPTRCPRRHARRPRRARPVRRASLAG